MKNLILLGMMALGMSSVALAEESAAKAIPNTAQIIDRLSQVLPAGNGYYGREQNGNPCNISVSYLNSMVGPQVTVAGRRLMIANVWSWAGTVQFGQINYRMREIKETNDAFTLDFVTSPYPFGNPNLIIEPTQAKLVVKKLANGSVGLIEMSTSTYDRFYGAYISQRLSCGI